MKAAFRWCQLLILLPVFLPAPPVWAQTGAGYEQALESFRGGRYFEALTIIRRLVAEHPEQVSLRHLHGLTLGALGQFSEATRELEEVVRLAPDQASYRQDLGMTYLQLGEEVKALGSLQEAVRLDPANLLARLYLGRLLHNRNRSQDAFQQFREIEKRDPRFPTLHFHKSRVLLSLGQGQEATAELKQEIENYPDNPLPRLELADLLLKSGDLEGARAQLDSLERLNRAAQQPPPARFYGIKARVLQGEKRLDEAVEAATASIRQDPGFAQGYYILGSLLREKGDLQGAQKALAEFQRLNRPSEGRHP